MPEKTEFARAPQNSFRLTGRLSNMRVTCASPIRRRYPFLTSSNVCSGSHFSHWLSNASSSDSVTGHMVLNFSHLSQSKLSDVMSHPILRYLLKTIIASLSDRLRQVHYDKKTSLDSLLSMCCQWHVKKGRSPIVTLQLKIRTRRRIIVCLSSSSCSTRRSVVTIDFQFHLLSNCIIFVIVMTDIYIYF